MPYPDELDELELVVDRALVGGVWTPGTKWQASVVNPWITAINAIQETLGINPEGAYTDVATRITALEATWVTLEYLGDGDDMTVRFALDHTPVAGTLIVWVQKELKLPDPLADKEYFLDGDTVEFYTPPTLDHPIFAKYAYIPTP